MALWVQGFSCSCIVLVFFNMNKKTIVKEIKVSSFLIAKMYDIKLYPLLLARVCSTKRKQLV